MRVSLKKPGCVIESSGGVAGFDGVRTKERECVREQRTHTDVHKQKHTHTHRNSRGRLTSVHSIKHIHDQQRGRRRQQPGGLVDCEVFRAAVGTMRLLITQTDQNEPGFPPSSPPVLVRSPLQNTSFDGGSSRPTNLPPQDIISSILAFKGSGLLE